MAVTTQKMCFLCGKDVSQTKRTKDAAGRYYCQPCYGGLSHSQSVRPAAVATSSTAPSVPLPIGQAEGAQAEDRPDNGGPRRSNLLVTFWVFAALSAIAGTVLYIYVLKPQNDQIQKTLQQSMEQSDKNAQMSRQVSDTEADLRERRDLAFASGSGGVKEEFVVKVTNNYKWTKTQAIQHDPIMSAILKAYPDLDGPIRQCNIGDIWKIVGADADMEARDKNYAGTFARAIGGLKE